MFVLQDWLDELSLKQQTVLLSALRGCDGVRKNDISKIVSRYLRSVILKNAATPTSSFMSTSTKWEDIVAFRKDMDAYPTHYILHFIHAAEIIGYFHPDVEVSSFWLDAYYLFVDAMHLNVESKEINQWRLRDGVDSD